jgi:hypothetical protein
MLPHPANYQRVRELERQELLSEVAAERPKMPAVEHIATRIEPRVALAGVVSCLILAARLLRSAVVAMGRPHRERSGLRRAMVSDMGD